MLIHVALDSVLILNKNPNQTVSGRGHGVRVSGEG